MFDTIKKLKENKFLKFLWNFIYVILVILVLMMLLVVALQRFSNNEIALGGFRIFNIVTGSMKPEYEVGDILVAKEIDAKDIKIGDDVVYEGKEGDFAGRIVTHRVKEIHPAGDGTIRFVTQGIANDLEDPEITDSQIKGKIIYKTVILSFISKVVNNLYSMYFVVFIPIAIIIFINIRRIYLDIVNPDNDEEEEEDKKDKKE